ncbi:TPA: hypothetical protein ACGRIC_002094, partial [Listeria monocytogenes]
SGGASVTSGNLDKLLGDKEGEK